MPQIPRFDVKSVMLRETTRVQVTQRIGQVQSKVAEIVRYPAKFAILRQCRDFGRLIFP